MPEVPSDKVWSPRDYKQHGSALLERVLGIKPSRRSAGDRGPHLEVEPLQGEKRHSWKRQTGGLGSDNDPLLCLCLEKLSLGLSLLAQVSKAQCWKEGASLLQPRPGPCRWHPWATFSILNMSFCKRAGWAGSWLLCQFLPALYLCLKDSHGVLFLIRLSFSVLKL